MKMKNLDHTTKKHLLIGILFSLSFFLATCATSPTGRKQLIIVPEDQMTAMGLQAFQDLKKQEPIDTDPRTNAYVKCVADAVTRVADEGHQPDKWEVVVFKQDAANAFALPGGKIGVYTGLLKVAKTPDQLATVLGHEVGHVLARHGNERVSEQFAAQGGLALISATVATKSGSNYNLLMSALGLGAEFGILLPHSRTQESEADVIGLQLMSKAGFNPRESIELWKNMALSGGAQPPEFLSTHPSYDTRMNTLQNNIPSALESYNKVSSRPKCTL